MAEQLKLSLSNGVHHCPLPLHLSDFIVGDLVLPVDFQYVSVTPHLKCQQYTLIIFLHYTSTTLPISLRQISSYGQFRRYLKNHLFGI